MTPVWIHRVNCQPLQKMWYKRWRVNSVIFLTSLLDSRKTEKFPAKHLFFRNIFCVHHQLNFIKKNSITLHIPIGCVFFSHAGEANDHGLTFFLLIEKKVSFSIAIWSCRLPPVNRLFSSIASGLISASLQWSLAAPAPPWQEVPRMPHSSNCSDRPMLE